MALLAAASGTAAAWLLLVRFDGDALSLPAELPERATRSIFLQGDEEQPEPARPTPAPTATPAARQAPAERSAVAVAAPAPADTAVDVDLLAPGRGWRTVPLDRFVTSRGCPGCSVDAALDGALLASVPGAGRTESAYALLDLGAGAGAARVSAQTAIGLGRGQVPAETLTVLRVVDVRGRVVFELRMTAPERELRLTSPAGGLRSRPTDVSTGAVVPNDGVSRVAVEVSARANDYVTVAVNGVEVASLRNLGGADSGRPRYLAAGIIAGRPLTTPVAASYERLVVKVTAAPEAPAPAPPAPKPSPAAPAATKPPAVVGEPVVGAELRADGGTWTDAAAALRYRWERCDAQGAGCLRIEGASGSAYALAAEDAGATVRVRVTATNAGGSATAFSVPLGPVLAAPVLVTAPAVTGAAGVGVALEAAAGTWSDPDAELALAWERCDALGEACVPVDGAREALYVPGPEDVGGTLRVSVKATNAAGSASAASTPVGPVVPVPAPTAPPVVAGVAVVGGPLAADAGAWNDPAATLVLAWERCDAAGEPCEPIPAATGGGYVPTPDDLGRLLRLRVTATNAAGSASAVSAPVGPVVEPGQVPPVLLVPPSVSGDSVLGAVAQASGGSWTDAAALLTFGWERCDAAGAGCAPIEGAVAAEYVLGPADVGWTVRAAVTATNAAGSSSAVSGVLGPVFGPVESADGVPPLETALTALLPDAPQG